MNRVWEQSSNWNPHNDKFWMVVGIQECGNGPKVFHKEYDKALAEATRLAKLHAGVTFVVLESKTQVTTQSPVDIKHY